MGRVVLCEDSRGEITRMSTNRRRNAEVTGEVGSTFSKEEIFDQTGKKPQFSQPYIMCRCAPIMEHG